MCSLKGTNGSSWTGLARTLGQKRGEESELPASPWRRGHLQRTTARRCADFNLTMMPLPLPLPLSCILPGAFPVRRR